MDWQGSQSFTITSETTANTLQGDTRALTCRVPEAKTLGMELPTGFGPQPQVATPECVLFIPCHQQPGTTLLLPKRCLCWPSKTFCDLIGKRSCFFCDLLFLGG